MRAVMNRVFAEYQKNSALGASMALALFDQTREGVTCGRKDLLTSLSERMSPCPLMSPSVGMIVLASQPPL